MVGTQAVFNVILGERYKMIPKEIKAYVRGEYGKPTVEIPEEIRKKIIGEEKVMTERPADLIKPQLEEFHKQMKEYQEQDEDILSYALFPQIAEEFFKYRQAEKYKIDHTMLDKENDVHPV